VDLSEDLAVLQILLLTPEEIGPGFTGSGFAPLGADEKLPCGQPALPATYQSAVVGSGYNNGAEVSAVESVDVYKDAATPQAAFGTLKEGFDCTEADLQGTPGTITPGEDIAARIGAEQATMWIINVDGARVAAVAAQANEALLALTMVVTANADLSQAPEPLDVAKKAFDKLAQGF